MCKLTHQAPRGAARRGFSLIEMIIAVTVIGIIAGLAVPMLGNANTSRLKSAAHLLAADIAYAQAESITHGDDLRLVVFDTATHTYHIAPASTPDTPVANPVGGLDYAVTFGQGRARQLAGVTINTLSMDGDSGSTADRFQFGLYGQLDQADDATIVLGCDGMSITVTIEASTGETVISDLVKD